MSSVAVLTQESFAEHRSGLVPQQIKGDRLLYKFSLLTLETGLLLIYISWLQVGLDRCEE